MRLLLGLLAGVGVLCWPDGFEQRRLLILSRASSAVDHSGVAPWSVSGRRWGGARQLLTRLPGRRTAGVSMAGLLDLLEAIAPALEAGMTPASALQTAADARSDSGAADPLVALARGMALAAADGAPLAPLWREAAESASSAELLLLAHAWSLTEDLGVPLAQAVRTTAGLLEARIAQERRLVGAVAGARATVNVLTVLPVGGPLLALVLGIGPGELYGGSRLTQGSLALGLALACLGRWWVRTMVRAVARGPVMT